ncbi:AAA family ATPase [Endozoicomonas sp. 4G]|uniref:AAA family ATPase n=1 Tax=Endozoicomonas sp. 4G TaxID=2872754 RepID=UPI00207861B3|nr:AAA family ATPase [Endozoicomonas sp. 4G]
MQPVTNDKQLTHLRLDGFKSIRSCDLELGSLNILIGANGAGKTNFISFFRFIGQILAGNLQRTVGKQGGPDALLRGGRKVTRSFVSELYFGDKVYVLELEPTVDNRMMFQHESLAAGGYVGNAGHFESYVGQDVTDGTEQSVCNAITNWRVYHFHDTSETALVKQSGKINDNEYLRQDACNLAAFLLRLKLDHPAHYKKIVRTIQLVAPFFGDFHLRPTPQNADQIELEWIERGMDVPLKAYALSDGTLRFICLTTVLNQPEGFMPTTLLIDAPELGLHPYAIAVLAAQLKAVSLKHQVIVSTQSVELVNEFEADDLVIVNRHNGETVFERTSEEKLKSWLEEYSLGEVWKKNLLGGRPSK